MFFTGEYGPSNPPMNFYACANKHVKDFREHEAPDWGDSSVSREWRRSIQEREMNYYEAV